MYHLGTVSASKLLDCQVDLARGVRRAIEITVQDFMVFEVLRELERQRLLVASGASRTLDSFHLADKYGMSHATDLVPWIAGKPQWQNAPCIEVARAMHRASKQFSLPVTWGGVWDKLLTELDPEDLEGEIEEYVQRWRRKHLRPPGHIGYWGPLIDRPHFQVPRS